MDVCIIFFCRIDARAAGIHERTTAATAVIKREVSAPGKQCFHPTPKVVRRPHNASQNAVNEKEAVAWLQYKKQQHMVHHSLSCSCRILEVDRERFQSI